MTREERDSSTDDRGTGVDERSRDLAKKLLRGVADIFDASKWKDNNENNSDGNKKAFVPYPSPVRPKLGAVEDGKWWNEYPLEGDPNRPAVLYAKLLSKSPRLIGWDDEKWEKQAIEIMNKNRERDRLRPPDETPSMDARQITPNENGVIEIDNVNFGFIERVANVVAERIERFVKAADLPPDAVEKNLHGDTKLDEDLVSDSKLYQSALSSLRWQRDAYLVGPAYATQRQLQRRSSKETTEANASPVPQEINWNDLTTILMEPKSYKTRITSRTDIPYDASALGNIQLARLGEWFIPSRTVQKTLLPIVLGLPQGPFYPPAYNVLTNLIPMSQPTLDRVLKNTVIWFLQDEQWRQVIKSSMNGYISTTYRDDSPRSKQNDED